MKLHPTPLAVAAVFLFASSAAPAAAPAATWTSADGKLAFDLPPDGLLVEVAHPPAPAAALWRSPDGRTRLMVIAQAVPVGTRLGRAGLEEGMVKSIPGGVLLPTAESAIADVPVYTLAATNARRSAYLQQSVLVVDGTVYKVMSSGSTPASDTPALAAVFASIRLPLHVPGTPAAGGRPTITSGALSTHDWSVRLGEIGFLALVVGIIAIAVRQSGTTKSPALPPPLPPRQ